MSNIISGRMLLFDGVETKFHNIRLRPKSANCAVCGKNSSIHELIDYEKFCGAKTNDKEPNLNLLDREERITVEEYNRIAKVGSESHVLIDVRSLEEYQICHLQNSINIPLMQLGKDHSLQLIRNTIAKAQEDHNFVNCKIIYLGVCRISLYTYIFYNKINFTIIFPVYLICRRGNDSQKAVQRLKYLLTEETIKIRDIIGGIHAWSNKIDPKFPKY